MKEKKKEKQDYKGFPYEYYPEYSAIVIDEYNKGDEVARVVRASTYTELIGHLRPEILVVKNNSETDFLTPFFKTFLRSYLFKDMLEYGIKRVFFILSEEEYEIAKTFKDKPDYVTHCRSMDEVIAALEKEKK
ncbi:MAG: hypothetical protein V4642_02600 [Bacteroidota bacterium]